MEYACKNKKIVNNQFYFFLHPYSLPTEKILSSEEQKHSPLKTSFKLTQSNTFLV